MLAVAGAVVGAAIGYKTKKLTVKNGINWKACEAGYCDKRSVELMHIAKNAGTMLEVIAHKAGMIWGACHFQTDTVLFNKRQSKILYQVGVVGLNFLCDVVCMKSSPFL